MRLAMRAPLFFPRNPLVAQEAQLYEAIVVFFIAAVYVSPVVGRSGIGVTTG